MTRTAIILITLSLLLYGCGERRTPEERIVDARQSIEISRFRDAIIEMRSLLRSQPNYAPARITLGEALMAVGDMAAAEKEYLRARKLGASPELVFEPLARVYQSRDAHDLVLAEVTVDQISDPVLASTLRALRARSLQGVGLFQEAQSAFDAEIAAGVSEEAERISLLGKATAAAEQGQLTDAEALIIRAMELMPESPESILALGRLYLSQKKYGEAKKMLATVRDTRMQARRQDWFFIEGQMTEALLGAGELDAARKSAAALVGLDRTHPMAAYLQGRVEFESGNVADAIQYFQQVLADYPSYSPALTLMGVAMIELDDFDQAEMHLSRAVASDPLNVETRRLLAETRMRMGRSSAAVETLKAGLRNQSADAQMITMLGRESMRIGEHTDGLSYLQDALAAAPDNLQANLALAQAHLSEGNVDSAVKVLEALPASVISEEQRTVLIRVAQMDRNNRDAAQVQIEQLLEEVPNELSVIGLAGSFFAAVGEDARAREYFDRVLRLSPGNRSAMLSLLSLDERAGDLSGSQALFEAAHRESPRDLLPTLVLARIYSAQGDDERALTMTQLAYDNNPTALLPNLMLASRAMQAGDLDTAEQMSKEAVERYSQSSRAHALYGLIRMRQLRYEEASSSFRRAVLFDADDAQYRFYFGQAEWAKGRLRQARNSFSDALSRDPMHLGAMRSLGMMDAQAGKSVQAETMVKLMQDAFAGSRAAQEAVADVRSEQGLATDALALYEAAQDSQMTWSVAQKLYRLRAGHQMDDPLQSLRAWTEYQPDDPQGFLKIAQAHQRAGESEAAIRAYERAIELQVDSAVAMNNVAWLYLERAGEGDLERAESTARRAYRRAPADPNVGDTYGWILLKANNIERGREVLRDAMMTTNAQDSPDLAYHYAVALNARGNSEEARKLLDLALRSDNPFASRDDAERLRISL